MPAINIRSLHIHHFSRFVRRDYMVPDDGPQPAVDLSFGVLGLCLAVVFLFALLFVLRRVHRNRRAAAASDPDLLPPYDYHCRSDAGAGAGADRRSLKPRSLTIRTHDSRGRPAHSVVVFDRDGQPMLANPNSPPHSPDNVPQIHVTFPDEHDERTGMRRSGRVVVVRIGEAGAVGMEPLANDAHEQLPAYEKESKDGFYSVDMDRIGGLKEKERTEYY